MEKQEGNQYFEQQIKSIYGAATEEQLVQRVSDCSMVVDRLDSDPVWKVVIADASGWVSRLDSSWQDIRYAEKLNQARVLKTAYMHIANLPMKYKEDLDRATQELNTRKNVDNEIIKDYDTE